MADYIKCGPRVTVSLPHDFLEELKEEAHDSDTDVSKLILDYVFKAKKGVTHSIHKAQYQSDLLDQQAKTLHQKSRSK